MTRGRSQDEARSAVEVAAEGLGVPMPEAQAAALSPRFARIVARLTGVNLLVAACAVITSPVLSRALGPSGRGEVAAIFSIVGLAPWISELGVTSYISRERARQTRPLGVLLGSMMPISLAGALVGAAAAVAVAHLVGRGRATVVEFIEIALYLLPIAVFVGTLSGIVVAEQRWKLYMTSKVVNTCGATLAIVTMGLLHALTVANVAITYIVFGIGSTLPFLIVLRGSWPWRFVWPVTKEGFVFGVRSWLSTIAQYGNVQLDQVLMAGLVDSRQLGLYAVAVSLSTVPSAFIGAVSNALIPRVAGGDLPLAARASRVTFGVTVLFDACVAAASPVLLPLVFGHAFAAAVPMLIVLLAAGVMGPPVAVLGAALIAGGHPGATARGQMAGFIFTVPALILVLPRAGAMGAAWVTLAAYGITFVIIVASFARTFAFRFRSLLVVNRDDARWLHSRIRLRLAAS